MEPVDWRTQFSAEYRQKVVNKIVITLQKCFPPSHQHISEIKDVAVKFEEKVYMISRNQKEYIMKIKSRLEAMDSSSTTNRPYSGPNTLNPDLVLDPQCCNKGQSVALRSTDRSPAREQHSLPNVSHNIASAGVSASIGSTQPISNVSSAEVPLQSVFGNVQKPVPNLPGQREPFISSANNFRQEQGRQHSPNIDTWQKQLIPHLCKQVKQENISLSSMTQQKQLQQQQQQQQKLQQPTQQQISQQSVLQIPSIRPSEAHVAPISGHRQDQMLHSVIKNRPDTTFRNANQSQGDPDIHHNVSSKPENLLIQSQKQPNLIGRKLVATNIQQNQSKEQTNCVPNLKQQQSRQPCQQNSVPPRFQVQKKNISSTQREQLGERNNTSVLQKSSGIRHCKVEMQGETQVTQQTAPAILPNQRQCPQWQLNSQSHPKKMQQLPISSEQDQQQTCATSGTPSSTSAQKISCIHNWQEEIYQKVESLRSMYLPVLSHVLKKLTYTLQKRQSEIGNVEKLKEFKLRLVNLIKQLNVPKSEITPAYKDSLATSEKLIAYVLGTLGRGKHAPSLQHGQLSSDVHSTRELLQSHHSKTPHHVQTHREEDESQLQSVNTRGSATTMQQSNATNLKQPKEERDVQTENLKQELQDRHKMQLQLVQRQKMVQQHNSLVKLQSGASCTMDLPKIVGSSCSQAPRCSSMFDMKNLPMPLTKSRTSFYPMSSPATKSASLGPLDSSSIIPGDSDKPISNTSSLSNASNIEDEEVNGAPEALSPFVISTPGISASPFLEESNNDIDCKYKSTIIPDDQFPSEEPIQRLIKAVRLMSSESLSASLLDIGSVVCATDRISGSTAVTGSRDFIDEDFVAMNYSHLQKRYLTWQDKTFGTREMKRCRSTVPVSIVASETGSIGDSLSKLSDMEKFDDFESPHEISYIKRSRIEVVNEALLEEITAINQKLIDTVLDISDEDTTSPIVDDDDSTAHPIKGGGQGTIVRCSFIAFTINPTPTQLLSAQMLPIQPLRLLVPANYPLCSPIFLDNNLRVEISDEIEDLSAEVNSKFNISLRTLTQPLSLGEIAKTWDFCVRAVMSEHAQKLGGGSFTSKYGNWEIL